MAIEELQKSPGSKAPTLTALGRVAIAAICIALVASFDRTRVCEVTHPPAIRNADGLEVTIREVDCDPGFGAGSVDTYLYLHRVSEADRKDNLILRYGGDDTPEVTWISPTRLKLEFRGHHT